MDYYEEFCEYWGLVDYDPYDPFEMSDEDITEAWLESEITRCFGDGWK